MAIERVWIAWAQMLQQYVCHLRVEKCSSQFENQNVLVKYFIQIQRPMAAGVSEDVTITVTDRERAHCLATMATKLLVVAGQHQYSM